MAIVAYLLLKALPRARERMGEGRVEAKAVERTRRGPCFGTAAAPILPSPTLRAGEGLN
jgi:hypothetical protein